MNARKSVDILLDYILEELRTLDYYHLLMLDLPKILESGTSRINSFFRNDGWKQGEGDTGDGLASNVPNTPDCLQIEIPLDQSKVGMFSIEPICYLRMNSFVGMHEIQPEIEHEILERDRQHMKENEDKL